MPVRITGSHARVWNVLKDPLEIPHYRLVGSTRGTPRNLLWSCPAESSRLRACPSQIEMNLRP